MNNMSTADKQEKRTRGILMALFVFLLILLVINFRTLIKESNHIYGSPNDLSTYESHFKSKNYFSMLALEEENKLIGYTPKYDVSEHRAFAWWYFENMLADGYEKLGEEDLAVCWNKKSAEHFDSLTHYELVKKANEKKKAHE